MMMMMMVSQREEEEGAGEEAGSDPGQPRHARPASQQRWSHASSSPPASSCVCGPTPALSPPTASTPASPIKAGETGQPAAVSCPPPCQWLRSSR